MSVISMTEEEITNLRNLHRLALLISGLENIEGPRRGVEEASLLKNQALPIGEISQLLYQLASIRELLPIFSVVNEVSSCVGILFSMYYEDEARLALLGF
ncbi:hypothetical protein Dimus_024788 [Dionaea muscipula]